jgi:hypothetical protein
MKTAIKTLLIITALAFAYPGQAQYVGASVDYIKVKPDQWNNYLDLEKYVKKFHQARMEKGIIAEWHLYQKMYGGADDPYDFIIVAFFDDYNKTENPYPQELIDEMYTSEEQADFWKKAGETRTMVKSEYFDQEMVAEGGKPAKYIRINRYKVNPGDVGEYTQLRRDITKPLFEELIRRDYLAGWTLWHKLGYDLEYQWVSVDAFAEFGQWQSGYPYQEVFKEVHPDKDMNEIQPRLSESRTQVNSEYWKLVDFVVPLVSAE